jgi:hypothetical protein
VVGLGLSLLYLLQEKLIYVPRVPGVTNDLVYTPDKFGFKYEVCRHLNTHQCLNINQSLQSERLAEKVLLCHSPFVRSSVRSLFCLFVRSFVRLTVQMMQM